MKNKHIYIGSMRFSSADLQCVSVHVLLAELCPLVEGE